MAQNVFSEYYWFVKENRGQQLADRNQLQGRAQGGFQGFQNPPFLGNNVDFFSIFAIFVTVLFFYFSLIETKPSLDFKSSQKNHFQNSLVMNLQANRSACNIIFVILFLMPTLSCSPFSLSGFSSTRGQYAEDNFFFFTE